MATNEVKLQKLEPKDKVYRELDGGGLFVEVQTDGTKFWRLRYKLAAKERITLGKYPAHSLAEARQWRTDCLALIELGISPRALKQGQITLNDVKSEAKELASTFLEKWCPVAAQRNKVKNTEVKEIEKTTETKQVQEIEKTTEVKPIKAIEKAADIKQPEEIQDVEDEDENEDTLDAFAQRLDAEIAELAKSKLKQKKGIKSAKNGDIAVADASSKDGKNLGAGQAVPQQSNVLKRLLSYIWKK